MAFLIHLTVPKKRAEEVSGHLRDSEYVKSFSKLEGEASFNYFFRVAASNLIDCLKELDNAKIGIDYGIGKKPRSALIPLLFFIFYFFYPTTHLLHLLPRAFDAWNENCSRRVHRCIFCCSY